MIWKKSSFTAQENCVELAHLGSAIAVRDSKDPSGPVLTFPQLPSGPPSIVMATKIMHAPNAE
ncbi:DUF397 domain-containing protein [Actinophytocola sp.]|uniref:DUF397 domain-containing protein n=1 Tax=Actinophytocola sp. TaxID=1872138 RepID=UPI003899DD91